MSRILKAASGAAVLLMLASVLFTTDSGYASNLDKQDSLASNPILIDPTKVEVTGGDAAKTLEAAQEQLLIEKAQEAKAPVLDPARDVRFADEAKQNENETSSSNLAELVASQDVSAPLDGEQRCLAGAVYFESKGESLSGQLAVAKVVLSRVSSGRFPSTICGVVYQKSQFSFVRNGQMPAIPTSSVAWQKAKAIARIAQNDAWDTPVDGALFFHARRVSPGWRLTRLGLIDNHVFYR